MKRGKDPQSIGFEDVIESGGELIRSSSAIKFSIQWAVLMEIWAIGVVIIWFIDNILLTDVSWVCFIFWILLGGICISLFMPVILINAWEANKAMTQFLNVFNPFWYKVKFEMLPAAGKTDEEQIWNKLQETFPGVAKKGKKIIFNETIKGKKKEHKFNIYISRPISEMPPSMKDSFIRIFDHDKIVNKTDLGQFVSDVKDVNRKKGHSLGGIVAVSSIGFDDDAIDYANNEKNLMIVLLLKKGPNFKLISKTI